MTGGGDDLSPRRRSAGTILIGLGISSWLVYAAIGRLSGSFAYGVPGPERPLALMLALFAVAFALYFVAVATIARARDSSLSAIVVWFSIAFRVLLLFSEPIQEIDAYRYVWDGHVTAAGISPFRHSPARVLSASLADDDLAPDLRRLVELRDRSPELHAILARVHFSELTTIYPPVSQAVFALAATTTPPGSSVWTQVVVMKAWIVAFDVATLFLVMAILRHVGCPTAWAAAYGWCPLVLKEFANSGHLDSIAVCLTTLAVYLALEGLRSHGPPGRLSRRAWLLSAVVLGLAVGAKLSPVVLLPWLILRIGSRCGLGAAAVATVAFAVTTVAVLAPMSALASRSEPTSQSTSLDDPPLPDEVRRGVAEERRRGDSQSGLTAFATRWEMNDFLFLLLHENLRPPSPGRPAAWFVVLPATWRTAFVEAVATRTGLDPAAIPFLLTRGATAVLFLCLAGWFAVRGTAGETEELWLEYGFLTLAWFWLLLPTQNPWYWTWALPLLPFARGRAWWAVSAIVMAYYTRFWFADHAGPNVLGTGYDGTTFFDFVATWFEYAPWFAWLWWESLPRNAGRPVSRLAGRRTPPSKIGRS